jgi:hypothetical protein
MAVGALYPMDVVRAGCAEIRGIHLLDIETAVGHLRMAGFARGACILIVSGMAGDTAQAFMDAYRSAIVS